MSLIDGTRITPGTEGCVCGPNCEMPCWQKLGQVDVSVCCCASRVADQVEQLEALCMTMIGAYHRWKLFPARDQEFGPRYRDASRRLRHGIVAARRAGLSDVELAKALRMTAPAASEWADVLVRAADRSAGPAQNQQTARGGDDV